jgi:membrane associated rhomboid family serine protease
MTFLKMLFIAVCGLIVGTAGFSATMDCPNTEAMFTAVLFSPLLALGGWFMFFLILPLVAAMWSIRTSRVVRSAWLFVVIGVAGTGISAVFTGGPEPKWRLAFAVGGCLAGAVSNAMIVLLKSTTPKEGAAPNGGPVTQLGNSGVAEGPPSVI